MDQSLPLYRQFTSRFLLLALSFFSLIFLGLTLYFTYQQELLSFKNQQFPAAEKFNQQQHLLIKNERLINQVLESKFAGKFDEYYQALNDNLNEISKLSPNNRRLLEELSHRLTVQSESIMRLVASDSHNIQLKESVLIQLALVDGNLSSLITEQKKQQQTLYRQLNQNTLLSQVAITKAKEFSDLVNNLNINYELQLSLLDTLMMFNQLDLQYSLVEFNYIQEKVQRDVSHWLLNYSNLSRPSKIEKTLFEQMSVLKALFFDEQQTFAHWRGQLRRFNDFSVQLKLHKIELRPLLDKNFIAAKITPNFIEKQLFLWSKKANIAIQSEHIAWVVIAVFFFISLIFIGLLLNIRNKIQQFGEESLNIVEEFVDNGEISAAIPSHETAAMVTKLQQITKPAHTEADFQRQLEKFYMTADLMSRHTASVCWQLPELSTQVQLSALLGEKDVNQKHWRHCFSRDDVRKVLACARKVKAFGNFERITLCTSQGKAIFLTIEYISGTWCGSVSSAEEYQLFKEEYKELQQQLQQQIQTEKHDIIASCAAVSVKLTKAILHHQLLSLRGGYDREAFQHLRKLVIWTEQQQISAQLRLDDFFLSLSTVKLANEIQMALANVSFNQSCRHNAINLVLDENLAPLVTLESELFQALIKTICHKLLVEQRGAELNVRLRVIDVNSAQQIVRMSFVVAKPLQPKRLTEVINNLVFESESNTSVNTTEDRYLNDLQLVFNVSNKASEIQDNDYKFSFELPLAIANERSRREQHLAPKLGKCTLLLIATDKQNRERIHKQLITSEVKVETMHDLTLLQRQVSVKSLIKSPIDAIILSPEVYCSDYELITEHLASLPTANQPKILVLQPFNSVKFQRAGLFSASDKPWFSGDLLTHVETLLKGKSKTNLLIEPEIFSPYRFARSQVEVLLGVSILKENQALVRILHWLGLQVTVVSQQNKVERLWQSGRYLIAITEFDFIKQKINDSEDIVRGVFKLSNDNGKQSFISKSSLPKSWVTGYLAPTLDIQKLIQQLSPWLKLENGENKTPLTDQKLTLNPADRTSDIPKQKMLTTMVEQTFDLSVDHAQSNKMIKAAFDLTQYAQNQGSAELAAFMIDDYIADIGSYFKTLERAFAVKNYHLAEQSLQSLILLANVISAKDLLSHCRELSVLIKGTKVNKDLSEKQIVKFSSQFLELKLCLEQLAEFAESI